MIEVGKVYHFKGYTQSDGQYHILKSGEQVRIVRELDAPTPTWLVESVETQRQDCLFEDEIHDEAKTPFSRSRKLEITEEPEAPVAIHTCSITFPRISSQGEYDTGLWRKLHKTAQCPSCGSTGYQEITLSVQFCKACGWMLDLWEKQQAKGMERFKFGYRANGQNEIRL